MVDVIHEIEGSRLVLIEEAASSADQAHLCHYSANTIRERLDALLDQVLECLRTRTLAPISEYARAIARQRFESGCDLGEVQIAIRALELALWRHVFAVFPADEVALPLGLVTTILGTARDTLARAYVELAHAAHAPALDVDSLFSGTISGGRA